MRNAWIAAVTTAAIAACPALGQVGIDFETLDGVALPAEGVLLAGDYDGALTALPGATVHGYHHGDPPNDWWGGYGVSNRTAVAGDDVFSQYTTATGTDHTIGAGGTYAIGYDDWEDPLGCRLAFAQPTDVAGMWLTHIAWTPEWIADNYGPGDYYHLHLTAYDENADEIGQRVVDMTANTDWTWYSTGWQGVSTIGVTMASSNVNTPTYFAMDDINLPEPGTIALLALGGLMLAGRRRGTRTR